MEKTIENFKIIKCDEGPYPYMVIILFCHSKVNQRLKIIDALNQIGYEGDVLFDDLMQVGVDGLRFYKSYFKENFQDNGYIVKLPSNSIYRKLSCDYLRNNNLVTGSNLSQKKIDAINNGEII